MSIVEALSGVAMIYYPIALLTHSLTLTGKDYTTLQTQSVPVPILQHNTYFEY